MNGTSGVVNDHGERPNNSMTQDSCMTSEDS